MAYNPYLQSNGKRRGAPNAPERRRKPARHSSGSESVGFEGLISRDDRDVYLSGWLVNEEKALEALNEERRAESRLDGDSRQATLVSSVAHVLIFLYLFLQPLDLFGPSRPEQPQLAEEPPEALLTFFPPPEQLPPMQLPPQAVPIPPVQAAPEPPPSMADSGIQLPRALRPPPPGEREFMNDLPFAEGNTDEFYTDEEVKDPGEEGDPSEEDGEADAEESLAEDEAPESEDTDGSDNGDDIDQERLRELLDYSFPLPNAAKPPEQPRRAARRIEPPRSSRTLGADGERGQGGTFSDPYEIRRFLENTQFHNPDGGLVSNKGNTLYYNDKGANFVPWIMRLISEVKRNWLVPYSAAYEYGHVAIGITVNRDGSLADLQIIFPSGTSGFDNAAVGALRGSRLPPLPSDYPDERFDIILVFWYNERPYDIFG